MGTKPSNGQRPDFNPPPHVLEAINRAKGGQSSNVSNQSYLSNRQQIQPAPTRQHNNPPPPPESKRVYPLEVVHLLDDLDIGNKQYIIIPTDYYCEEDSPDGRIYTSAQLKKRKNVSYVGYLYQGQVYYKGSAEFAELAELSTQGIEDIQRAVAFYQNPPKPPKQSRTTPQGLSVEDVEEIVLSYYNRMATPAWLYIMVAAQAVAIVILFGFVAFS